MKANSTLQPVGRAGPPCLVSSLIEHAPLPMAAVEGPLHIVRHVNPAFCRLLDKPVEQILGTAIHELLPAKDACVSLLDSVYQTGNPETYVEEEYPDLHPVLWSYTMWPFWEDERINAIMIQVAETAQTHERALVLTEALVLGSVRQHEIAEAEERLNSRLRVEISERKEVEAALRESREVIDRHALELEEQIAERTVELTATNAQMEMFVYSIAHDLRAPLRAMQGYASMLMETLGAAPDEKAREYAGHISKSAQFMDSLLISLLDFSRVAQQGIDLTPVSLETTVKSVMERLQPDIWEKGARLDISGPWPVVLAHDPTLAQMLFNLACNALKFVTPGTPPVLRIWAREYGDYTRVWIEDNGVGIAPDHQKEIFRLFTRLNGEEFPGTGIGLAIVWKGAERMGGRAGVESMPGHGSRFWFELRTSRTS